jgi:hypothetical protein
MHGKPTKSSGAIRSGEFGDFIARKMEGELHPAHAGVHHPPQLVASRYKSRRGGLQDAIFCKEPNKSFSVTVIPVVAVSGTELAQRLTVGQPCLARHASSGCPARLGLPDGIIGTFRHQYLSLS